MNSLITYLKLLIRRSYESLPVLLLFIIRIFKRKRRRPCPNWFEGRTLIIDTNGIGDLVRAQPAIAVICDRLIEGSVDILVRSFAVDVLKTEASLNEIFGYHRQPYPPRMNILLHQLKLLLRLRRRKYRTIINLSSNFSTNLLSFLIGAKIRVAYDRKEKIGLFTVKSFWPFSNVLLRCDRSLPSTMRSLDLVKQMGIPVNLQAAPKLDVTADAKTIIDRQLRLWNIELTKKLVVFSPGSPFDKKRWPSDYYKKLIRLLVDEGIFEIVVAGNKTERPLIEKICKDNETKVHKLASSLQEFMALIERAELWIGNDSGGMHLAAALGTKVVALFGPTDMDKIAPRGPKNLYLRGEVDCQPCGYLGPCAKNQNRICMTRMQPEMLFAKIKSM